MWNRIERPEINIKMYSFQQRRQEYKTGKKTVFLASGAGKVGKLHVKSMKLGHALTSCTKINLK